MRGSPVVAVLVLLALASGAAVAQNDTNGSDEENTTGDAGPPPGGEDVPQQGPRHVPWVALAVGVGIFLVAILLAREA